MKTRSFVPIEQRFWRYVEKTETCWLWVGATTNGGYGVIHERRLAGNRLIRANRLSYEMANGPIESPKAMVCHRCDNPKCVNPAHLFLGTQLENMQDAAQKGRAKGPALKGERHPQAKLDGSSVLAIRDRYAAGGIGLSSLAAQYGVSKKAILNIVHRRSWSHI